ncbi:hypothetical protein BsWGS_10690 [Bradybaena similaris]
MEDDSEFEKADAKKMKTRVNIFDDNISLEAAKEIAKSSPINNEEDFDEEEINFDGSPIIKFNNRPSTGPVPPVPDISNLAVPATSLVYHTNTTATSVSMAASPSSLASRSNSTTPSVPLNSSAAYGSVSSAVMYTHNSHNRSMSFTTGSMSTEKGPPKSTPVSGSSSSLHDFDNAVGGSLKRQTSMDVDKLHQEIQSLKRSLLSAKRDRWVKLPIEDTLRRIIKGEDFSLELYRSLEDKLELLDKATQRHDGNAIVTAVLFLQRTVSKHIFTRELLSRPGAANHYLTYLKAHFDHAEYITILSLLGRAEEAAIFKFKLAAQTADVGLKISKLKDGLREHFQADKALATDASLVKDYIDLLERQRPVDDADANTEATGRSMLFRDFPRKRSLIDMPVVTTLYYCCLYHYDLSETNLASPEAIRKRHQISEKQYVWTAVSARAKLRQWKDIEALLTTKGFFGSTKMKSVIGFDKVVTILHKNSAPPDILEKYLAHIDDLELRLNMARKVSCPKAIVDAIKWK